LNNLLKHQEEADILCPNIIDIVNHRIIEPMVYTKNFLGGQYIAPRRAENCRIDTFGTHAVLISRKAVDTIGYYDPSLFFVGYEDTDYGYRAVKAGLTICFVAEATALHPAKLPTGKRFKIFPAQLNCKILPAHMGYLTDPCLERMPCSRTDTRWIAPFSKAYLESKYLKSWQFVLALVYAECWAIYCKIVGEKRIALVLTLRMNLKCLTYSLKKNWPYEFIEQLCREILK
jgi:hypothetical protein